VISVTNYAAQQHRESAALVDWEGELHGVVSEIRASLRTAQMLPAHDIRHDQEQVRALMASVEARLQTPLGRQAAGLASYALGEGSLALGDAPRALELLEAAHRAGVRGAQIDMALGRALGIVYEHGVRAAERGPAATRTATLQLLETRYRDPALTHLRAALAAGQLPPAYLEALLLFHQHRFADGAERAHVAFVESPMLYEAGLLEANARSQIAVAAQRAGENGEATQRRFVDACQAADRVLQIARSDDAAWLLQARLRFAQAQNLARDGELTAEQRATILDALRIALQINPGNTSATAAQAALRACCVCSADLLEGD
jgi:serine/threonine-protein kinase